MATLSIGTVAPDFTLKNQEGEDISLADFRGKQHVVVYFYPKDETPGCVAEACQFRDQYEAFTDAGAEVIGISADSETSHARFAQKRQLPFQLLSDPGRKIGRAYGVSGALFGLLPGRETFVVDKGGVIRHHFSSQFQINGHIDEALKVIKSL